MNYINDEISILASVILLYDNFKANPYAPGTLNTLTWSHLFKSKYDIFLSHQLAEEPHYFHSATTLLT